MADKSAFVPLDTSGDTSKTNDLDLDLDGDFFGDKGSGAKAPPPPPPKAASSSTSVPAKATSSTNCQSALVKLQSGECCGLVNRSSEAWVHSGSRVRLLPDPRTRQAAARSLFYWDNLG
ncbi:hypothetical protein Ddc_06036 [Ditylenchus destructor]|nr:hypothetical protein Ddc_06036 [Ditylenchus destructor]